jgi:hypothetical protein
MSTLFWSKVKTIQSSGKYLKKAIFCLLQPTVEKSLTRIEYLRYNKI